MSKLVFPGTGIAGIPYRGFVSEARTWFQRIASWAEKNGPESVTAINAQLAVLVTALGGVLAAVGSALSIRNSAGADAHTGTVQSDGTVRLAATVAMVDHGETLTINDFAGRSAAGTISVVNGVVQAGAAPSNAAVIGTGVKFPLGTVTGAPVTGWFATITFVNGVPTATTFTAS